MVYFLLRVFKPGPGKPLVGVARGKEIRGI